MSETAQTASATIVNDFSIMAATKNGSGSQTANLTILRTLFKMGIPVNGKNVFPSNIQGQPTWYWIRASKDGYLARTDEADIVISLNPDSAIYDYASVKPGGAFIYAEDLKMSLGPQGCQPLPHPHAQNCQRAGDRRAPALVWRKYGVCGRSGLAAGD